MPLKSPYSSLCSENSDPLFTIPASNYNTSFSLFPSPQPVQAGSWAMSVIFKDNTLHQTWQHRGHFVFIRQMPEAASHSKHTHIYSYCMTQKQQMSICQGLMWPYGNRSGSEMCRRENLYCCPHDRSLIITNDWGHTPDRTHPHPSQQLRWLIHRSSCFTGSLRVWAQKDNVSKTWAYSQPKTLLFCISTIFVKKKEL